MASEHNTFGWTTGDTKGVFKFGAYVAEQACHTSASFARSSMVGVLHMHTPFTLSMCRPCCLPIKSLPAALPITMALTLPSSAAKL